MCTVRYVGRFLPDDPLSVPWPVLENLAEQPGIEDASVRKRYTERPRTAYERAWEIRDAYVDDDLRRVRGVGEPQGLRPRHRGSSRGMTCCPSVRQPVQLVRQGFGDGTDAAV